MEFPLFGQGYYLGKTNIENDLSGEGSKQNRASVRLIVFLKNEENQYPFGMVSATNFTS